MKLNKLLVTMGLTFSASICLAQAERYVHFRNNTNKPITVQRLLKDDSCMKDFGDGSVSTISPGSAISWYVVDSNAWPLCAGQNKRTNFLINGNTTLSWSHSAGDGYLYWDTSVFVPSTASIGIKASCGDSGNDCSKGSVKDDNKDTYIYVNSTYNNNNWMSKMLDSDKLSSLVMPGSHDAGMSETHNCMPSILAVPMSETQSLGILDQAKAGSRYFDIRVDYDKDRLITYHRTDGLGCSGQPLVDILDQAVKFLRENSSETLILDFSHTRNYEEHEPADITKKVIELLSSSPYSNYLFKSATYTNLALVPLTQIRGKIIVIMDSEYSKYINCEQGFFNYNQLDIYNSYSNTTSFSDMQADQLDKLSSMGGLGQSYLFLLSWTLTPQGALDTVYGLAQIANSNLESGLINKIQSGAPKPNIIYLDFLNNSLNRSIIDLNF